MSLATKQYRYLVKVKSIYYLSALIFAWYLLYYFDFANSTIPSPFDVIQLLTSTEILSLSSRLLVTLSTVFVALTVSIIIGYAIGVVSSFSTVCYSIFYPFFNGIKSVPITVFLPLFLVVFHLEHFVVPMICVPLIATLGVNMANASRSVNGTRDSIANSLLIGRFAYFRHILFWETLETFFATLRVIFTYALTLEIALDYFLRYNKGIGDYISGYYESYYDDKYVYMYAGIVVASVSGIVLIKVLDKISIRFLQWKIQIH